MLNTKHIENNCLSCTEAEVLGSKLHRLRISKLVQMPKCQYHLHLKL